MKTPNNPWSVLGIQPDATLKEVKLAYKTLALSTHPDKGGKIADWLAVSNAYDEIQKNTHIPIVKATNTQMVNVALTVDQQINGISDYIKIEDKKELFIKVSIPPGALLGDKFKVMHKGTKYIINVKEKADKVFTRSGNSLIMYKTVDIIDVMKRNSFLIMTPTGEYCEIDVPGDAQTGSIIILKKHGLYNRKTKKRGNLQIHIKVDVPYLNNDNIENFIKRLKNND